MATHIPLSTGRDGRQGRADRRAAKKAAVPSEQRITSPLSHRRKRPLFQSPPDCGQRSALRFSPCRAILLTRDPGPGPTSASYLLMRQSAQWLAFTTRGFPVSDGPLAYSTGRAGLALSGFPIPLSPRPDRRSGLYSYAATLQQYVFNFPPASPQAPRWAGCAASREYRQDCLG